VKRGILERAAVLHLDIDPAIGREQQGQAI